MIIYCLDCAEPLLDGSCAHCFAESAKAIQFPLRAKIVSDYSGHDIIGNKEYRRRLDAAIAEAVDYERRRIQRSLNDIGKRMLAKAGKCNTADPDYHRNALGGEALISYSRGMGEG